MYNPMMFMNAMKNPQVFMQQMMNNNQMMKNPIAKNAIDMMQRGDRQGTEQLARNLLKSKGIDPDEFYRNIQSQFGIK